MTFCYIVGTISVLVALPPSEVGNLQGLMQAISTDDTQRGFERHHSVRCVFDCAQQRGRGWSIPGGGSTAALRCRHRQIPAACIWRASSAVEDPMGRTAHSMGIRCFVHFSWTGRYGIKGAYDVLVSMGVITYFIPYLYLFAAMFKLQNEPAGQKSIRVPGGKPVARLVALVGL